MGSYIRHMIGMPSAAHSANLRTFRTLRNLSMIAVFRKPLPLEPREAYFPVLAKKVLKVLKMLMILLKGFRHILIPLGI